MLCALVALAACGGNDDDASPAPAPVATAPAAAPAAPSPAPAAPAPAAPAPAATPAEHGTALTPAALAANAVPANMPWRGVNLSGAEFTSTALPGTYGYQFIYPAVSSITYFQSRGMNLVRLPFLWERMQPTLYGNLDQPELQRLKDFVAGATAKGITVLIDPHSYGHYRDQPIGSDAVPAAAFGNFWGRLAGVFKTNSKVVFGLMNEPYGLSGEVWIASANEAIRSIRAAGAANAITVPGVAWTGAHSWSANYYGTPNAVTMKQITDSANNVLIEAHQYLDSDSSGTHAACVSTTIGAERLANFTAWLSANGKRGFLGEFAGANNDTCKLALAGMLAYMANNKDVWAGWSYWAAGPWWGDNMFSIEPATGGADKPQMAVLQPYL